MALSEKGERIVQDRAAWKVRVFRQMAQALTDSDRFEILATAFNRATIEGLEDAIEVAEAQGADAVVTSLRRVIVDRLQAIEEERGTPQ
jgi:hypothetical protein